jgi:hypothetical protein
MFRIQTVVQQKMTRAMILKIEAQPSRPVAIRRLVELGLKIKR